MMEYLFNKVACLKKTYFKKHQQTATSKSELTKSEPKIKTRSALKESSFEAAEKIVNLKDSCVQLKNAYGETQGIDSRC